MVTFAQNGHSLVLGTPFSEVAVQTGLVATLYGVAQLSPLAGASALANEESFPYFSRLGNDAIDFATIMKAALLHYGNRAGLGWSKVAVVAQITDFTLDLASAFVAMEIVVYQSFLPDITASIDAELREVQKSDARVIVASVFSGWLDFLSRCDSYGLIGDQYVYLGVPTLVSSPFFENKELSRGVLIPYTGASTKTPEFGNLVPIWQSLDPLEYPMAGPGTFPSPFATKNFDVIITAAKAIQEMNKQEKLDRPVAPEDWSSVIRSTRFRGVSGEIQFDTDGNVIQETGIMFYSPEQGWVVAGNYTKEDGYREVRDVVWYSNATELPDLDIRDPIDYWSCREEKRGYDATGKVITLETPDGSNVDDIDYDYHCDLFIDCQNFSDESVDCSTNYTTVFIVFGVLAGVMILICIGLMLFVCIFGMVLRFGRVRHCSPVFLIIILLSAILGISSIYAWFGKPHPVACGFQPWLLGLSTVSMISALSVKNFRIWRIFRFPLKRVKISDWELLVYWIATMVPAVFILVLWTIISTPTAALRERNDEEHFICTTGGFTGEPGGLVFFSILVAYNAIVLIAGAIISFAVQNAPSMFNESKLLKISIYNLGFLSVVIIPVYFVLVPFNPFSAWILRSCAVLYAFSATVFLQFAPMIFAIFVIDKGNNKMKHPVYVTASSNGRASNSVLE